MDTAGAEHGPARLALDRSDDRRGGVCLLATGEVDLSTLEQFREVIAGILGEPGVTGLLVDLGALDFIDSAGVQVLLGAKQEAAGRGITFSAANAHGRVLRVLSLLNVHDFLTGPGRDAAEAG